MSAIMALFCSVVSFGFFVAAAVSKDNSQQRYATVVALLWAILARLWLR